MSQPEGERAQSIKIRCNQCEVPVYEDLDVNRTYRIITPSFITGGGDGFTALSDNLKNTRVGPVDVDVFVKYLETYSPIFKEVEGRIEVVGGDSVRVLNLD